MIKSMTACAQVEKTIESQTVSVEMRTYNHRYLDIVLRLPGSYISLEERIKALLFQKISRGRVEVTVKIKDTNEVRMAYEIDELQANAYADALGKIKEMFHIQEPLTLNQLLGANGILRPVSVEKDMEGIWPLLHECVEEGLTALDAMRVKEGLFIEKDFLKRLAFLEQQVNAIEAASEGTGAIYQQRLKERILALTKDLVDIDMDRIVQEAAFMVDKSDITEEITRARSHIDQFHSILSGTDPVGQKINFLLQELNREFSTMGAKTPLSNVSHMVVDAKSEIEKLREQVQNIE